MTAAWEGGHTLAIALIAFVKQLTEHKNKLFYAFAFVE